MPLNRRDKWSIATALVLFQLSVNASAQLVTPHVGLQYPQLGSSSYYSAFQFDLTLLDSLLSGGSALPGIALATQTSVPTALANSNILFSKSSDGNTYLEYPAATAYRLGLMASPTVTANDCVRWDANGNLADAGGACASAGIRTPTFSGIPKTTASSTTLTQALPGTDYAVATSGSGLLAANNAGGFFNLNYPIYVTQPPYNADPTGATAATSAFQSAINAAQTAGGGTVYVPTGTYGICNITIPQSVSLMGSSGGGVSATNPITGEHLATELHFLGRTICGGDVPMVTFGALWSNVFENLTLQGGYTGVGTGSSTLLNFNGNPRNGVVRDVLLTYTGTCGAPGYATQGCAAVLINNGGSGMLFERVLTANVQGKALILAGTTGNIFIDCNFPSNGDDAIVINQGSDDNDFLRLYVNAYPPYYDVVLNYPSDPLGAGGGLLNNFTDSVFSIQSGGVGIYANNNSSMSFVSGAYAICCGTAFSTSGGGLVKFSNSLITPSPDGTGGFPNVFTLTATGTSLTWQNNLGYAVNVVASGGTLTNLQINRNGTGSTILPAASSYSIVVQPVDILILTYSATPTVIGVPLQ